MPTALAWKEGCKPRASLEGTPHETGYPKSPRTSAVKPWRPRHAQASPGRLAGCSGCCTCETHQTVSSVKGEPQHLCPVRTGAATSSHKQAPPRLTGVRGWGGNRAAGPAPAQPGAAAGALRHPAKGCRPGAPQRVLGVCVVRAAGYVSPGIWVSRHRGPGGATSLWHVYLGWPSDPSRLQTHSAACRGRSMVRILTHSP